MIDSLIALHFLNYLWLQASICPIEVPVQILVLTKLEVKPPCTFFDDSILGLKSAKNKLLLNFLLLRLLICLFDWLLFFAFSLLFCPDPLKFLLDLFVCVISREIPGFISFFNLSLGDRRSCVFTLLWSLCGLDLAVNLQLLHYN